MKRMLLLLTAVLCMALLTGCACEHVWLDASCTDPAVCEKCELTEGAPLGHDWQEATCQAPRTCNVCGLQEGEPTDHDWIEATYYAPKFCITCDLTEGEPLPRYNDEKILLDCNGFIMLYEQALKQAGYVILEWGGDRSEKPMRIYEIFDKDGPAVGMTLMVVYEPETARVVTLTFMCPIEEAELTQEKIAFYEQIAGVAYHVLCPEGVDEDLVFYTAYKMDAYGILIIPVNEPAEVLRD